MHYICTAKKFSKKSLKEERSKKAKKKEAENQAKAIITDFEGLTILNTDLDQLKWFVKRKSKNMKDFLSFFTSLLLYFFIN